MPKLRLDQYMVLKGLAPSREKAQALIMSGVVSVNAEPILKPGKSVSEESIVNVCAASKYVSRGGVKLEGALDDFELCVIGLRCLDAGASTGGFTDCLLQRGAASVHAVDVGYGLIDNKLRTDPRVKVIERTNARYLTEKDFDCVFDLITADLSFISLKKVLPALKALLAPCGRLLVLVKPQFEAGRANVGKGGVVRSEQVIQAVLEEISAFGESLGLVSRGARPARIKGPAGNQEYFILFDPKTST